MQVCKTERLIIREFNLSDAEFFLQLVNQPDWYRNIGDRNVRDIAAAENYIQDRICTSYQSNGYGMYLLERLDDGVKVGTCGLVNRPELEDVDIGFALLSQFYGQGFACEAAQAILHLAQHQHQIEQLLAIVNDDNFSSIKLIEKLGFSYMGEFRFSDEAQILRKYKLVFSSF